MEILLLSICSSLLAFTLTWLGANLFLREKFRVAKRVGGIAAGRESLYYSPEKKKTKKNDARPFAWLSGGKALQKIANLLSLAAIPLRAEEFLVLWASAALVPAGLAALFGLHIFVCLALIAAGSAFPPFLLQRAWKKRMALFDKQLIDGLSIIGNCLRAGFSFNQAIESIAQEMPDPIAKEFAKTVREIRLGLPMEKALMNMVDRLENGDLELIVSAVLIQRQVGGNLSEILDTIAGTIKDRLKIKGEIKVLTATGRTSGLVVGMLPVFLMGVLMIINPGYVSMFFNSAIGIAMLVFAAMMETIGFLIVKKIVNVKF